MAFTMKQLKHARDIIADSYGLPSGDAARVIGYYNGAGPALRPDCIENILAGDLSGVPAALAALGLQKIPVKENLNGSAEKKPPFDPEKQKAKKASAVSGSACDLPGVPASSVPAVDGDIVKENNNELPAGYGDRVEGWFNDFANKYGFDIYKLHAQQWRSACMYVGENIKASGVYRDRERERHEGGVIYSGEKLEKLLALWAYFCGIYKQVPLVSDFISFSGVSRGFFYDYDGRGLTAASVQLAKKARQIEETGLGASVAGGGPGAIGGMFLLKTRHGYSETVTIQHASPAAAVGVSDLPKLDIKSI